MPIPKNIIANIQKNDPSIKHIALSNIGLMDDDVIVLVNLIKVNNYIDSLDLKGNNITFEGAKVISILSLEELDIRDNNIGDEGAVFLLESKSIKKVKLAGNGVSNQLLANLPSKTNITESKIQAKYNSLKVNDKLLKLEEAFNKTTHFFSEKDLDTTDKKDIENLSKQIINQFNLKDLNENQKEHLIITLVTALHPKQHEDQLNAYNTNYKSFKT